MFTKTHVKGGAVVLVMLLALAFFDAYNGSLENQSGTGTITGAVVSTDSSGARPYSGGKYECYDGATGETVTVACINEDEVRATANINCAGKCKTGADGITKCGVNRLSFWPCKKVDTITNSDGSVTATVNEQQIGTLTVKDIDYEVTIYSVNSWTAKFVVNIKDTNWEGTGSLGIGGIFRLSNGAFLTVSSIISSNMAGGKRAVEFTIHPPVEKSSKPTYTINPDGSITDTLTDAPGKNAKLYVFNIGGNEKAYMVKLGSYVTDVAANFSVNNESTLLARGGIYRLIDGSFITVSDMSAAYRTAEFTLTPRPSTAGKPVLVTAAVDVAAGWNLVGLNTLNNLVPETTTCERSQLYDVAYVYYPEVVKSYGDGSGEVAKGSYGAYAISQDMRSLGEAATVPGLSALESETYRRENPSMMDDNRAAYIYNYGGPCRMMSNLETAGQAFTIPAGFNMLGIPPAWEGKTWDEIASSCSSESIAYAEGGVLPKSGKGVWIYTPKKCSTSLALLELPPLPQVSE